VFEHLAGVADVGERAGTEVAAVGDQAEAGEESQHEGAGQANGSARVNGRPLTLNPSPVLPASAAPAETAGADAMRGEGTNEPHGQW
jgi:hypothetical protein